MAPAFHHIHQLSTGLPHDAGSLAGIGMESGLIDSTTVDGWRKRPETKSGLTGNGWGYHMRLGEILGQVKGSKLA
jgi:hypothetical protein